MHAAFEADLSQVRLDKVGHVAVLTLLNPPVNSLSYKIRYGLQHYVKECQDDASVKVIVIIGDGKTFPAGANISEFPILKKLMASGNLPDNLYPLYDVIQEIENSEKPVIAAIHGTALGGGLEIALGCHYRIAVSSASFGLPEVQLGLLPGAGGTQRLPRLVDPQTALQMISTGRPLKAKKALKVGLIDLIVPENVDLRQFAIQYAQGTSTNGVPVQSRRVSHKRTPLLPDSVFDGAKKMASRAARGFKAPLACIDAVEAAYTASSFQQGLVAEQKLFARLMAGEQSAAQQYFFFAQRQASKVPGVSSRPVVIKSVGIIGAGTMGGGIAMCFAQAGVRVFLVDMKEEYVQRGLDVIRKNYTNSVKKGRMPAKKADGIMQLIQGTTNYKDLSDVDIAIEAVFENMDIKKKVLSQLDHVCKQGALLCTNTSTLDIDEIASTTRRPESVIGTHFFSPANKMQLLEIVRGKHTAPDVISMCLSMGKLIRKVSVVVGNCFGFVGNRMYLTYSSEATFCVEEGASPEQVDKVLYDFGFPMGPFSVGDLAGNDIGFKIRESLGLTDKAKRDPSVRYAGTLGDALVQIGRLGQKTGKGWYDYAGRSKKPSPEVDQLIHTQRQELGLRTRTVSDQEILERCLYPMINDAFNILEEGIAIRPSDIDVVLVYGYGWPVYRGGPMYYADQVGLRRIVTAMDKYAATHPNVPHWKVAPLLRRLADEGTVLAKYWSQRAKL